MATQNFKVVVRREVFNPWPLCVESTISFEWVYQGRRLTKDQLFANVARWMIPDMMPGWELLNVEFV